MTLFLIIPLVKLLLLLLVYFLLFVSFYNWIYLLSPSHMLARMFVCLFFLTLFPPFALLCVRNVEVVPVVPTRWQVWPCWPASWLLARPWSPTSSSPRRLNSDPWRSRATAWSPRWPGGGWAEEVFELKTVGTSYTKFTTRTDTSKATIADVRSLVGHKT